MSALSNFNNTVQEFLDALLEVFPEHRGVMKQKLRFEVGTRANCRLALDSIMPKLIEHSSAVIARDENILGDVDGGFSDIDLASMWNSGLSEQTKNTIWDYVNTLLSLGLVACNSNV